MYSCHFVLECYRGFALDVITCHVGIQVVLMIIMGQIARSTFDLKNSDYFFFGNYNFSGLALCLRTNEFLQTQIRPNYCGNCSWRVIR